MKTFSTAPNQSYVALPQCDPPYPALLDFLTQRFPKIARETWQARIAAGKVTDDKGQPITLDTPYRPSTRLRYYREEPQEPEIPFQEVIVFHNAHLLVACKPHFLPVTPAGPYVNQTLLARLIKKTGITELIPIHRIDRETAGLVMFSTNKATRGVYPVLFKNRQVQKVYEAIAALPEDFDQDEWLVESRIVPGEPWFLMQQVPGPANALTKIRLIERNDHYGYFRLEPVTGRQHQLRLHMLLIGCPILHDSFYPVLQPLNREDFSHPLQLLAQEIRFVDPLNQQPLEFHATRTLAWERQPLAGV